MNEENQSKIIKMKEEVEKKIKIIENNIIINNSIIELIKEINNLKNMQDLRESNYHIQIKKEYEERIKNYKEAIKEELNKKYEELLKLQLGKICNHLTLRIQKELDKRKIKISSFYEWEKSNKSQRSSIESIIEKKSNYSKCNNNLYEKFKEESSKEEIKNENNYRFIQNNNNITNNINIHNSNLIIRDIPNDILQKSKYSYKCINKDNLTTLIYKWIPEVKISLILKNDGDRTWVKNETKLIFDRDSDYSIIGDIILDPQKPNEQKKYDIIFKGLENYSSNQCNIILNFYCDNDYYGEQIYFSIKFKEKNC